jgi:hypothetical protein
MFVNYRQTSSSPQVRDKITVGRNEMLPRTLWSTCAFGEIEVERLKESRSMRLFGSRKSYAMEIATKPLVMASQISGLEPLHGYIKQEN